MINGRVQGVGYRYSTQREADLRGLSGWVRNLPDGRVEARFEGPPELVEDMVDWCRRGPSFSQVTDIEISEITDDNTSTGFRITR